jgi:hypothetical protein
VDKVRRRLRPGAVRHVEQRLEDSFVIVDLGAEVLDASSERSHRETSAAPFDSTVDTVVEPQTAGDLLAGA